MDKSPQILLDARKLGDAGIGVYIENLVEGLLALQRSDFPWLRLSLLVQPGGGVQSSVTSEATRETIERWKERIRVVEESSGNYSFGEYFRLAGRQRALLDECQLYHSPHYVLPYRLGIPSVVTIHDVIHVNRPETFYHRPLGRMLIRSAVRRAAHVITVSSTSLTRLVKVVGSVSTPISVIPNGLRRGIGILPRAQVADFQRNRGLEAPYFVFVGSDRPHKGFRELILSWRLLQTVCGREEMVVPKLVVVGSRFSDATRRLVTEHGLDRAISFMGELPIHELALLYNGSKGACVPSYEEGFGLVALEAMACGVPAICTPENSLKEVCGNCAWYAENHSVEAICGAVFASYCNPELSEAKINRGIMRARDFEREHVARRTVEVYEQVLNPTSVIESEMGAAQEPLSYGNRDVFDQHLRRAL